MSKMVREFKKVCTTTEFECYLYVSLCSLISSFNEVNDPQIHCLLGSLPTKIAYTGSKCRNKGIPCNSKNVTQVKADFKVTSLLTKPKIHHSLNRNAIDMSTSKVPHTSHFDLKPVDWLSKCKPEIFKSLVRLSSLTGLPRLPKVMSALSNEQTLKMSMCFKHE